MLGDPRAAPEVTEVPEAAAVERRGFSLIWLIPAVAGAVALWLGYTTIRDQGPLITVTFEDAEGLEAGTTKVKYKEVEVGLVEDIAISEDLSHVVVTARMVKNAAPYMNDGTEFWIVRPRIGAGGVSGLGTLVSGAYVEVDPGSGEPATSFKGLEEPPPIRSDVAGRRFQLRAEKLGSVSRGAPLYYRDVEVGQVLGYQLAEDRQSLLVDVFVAAPHDQLVRANSRFWNASGVQVNLGADGVEVSVASLQALLAGGISFDTPAIGRPDDPATAGSQFPLFESFSAVTESRYTDKIPYLVYFDGSVRGLRAGAPVEFRGMRIGSVTDVALEVDPEEEVVRIPVTIDIEPQRISMPSDEQQPEPYATIAALVERGLRAQLKSGNLLTGELLVDLDFHPDSPPATLDRSGPYPRIPSVPTQLEVLTASITGLLNQLAALPLPDLVADVQRTVQGVEALVTSPDTAQAVSALTETATRLQALVGMLERRMDPLLSQAEATLASTESLLGDDSQLRYDAVDLMRELTGAARSIRLFADYLERHPEALLRGKTGLQ
jgi:paraquat-inducible protein B